MGGDETNKSKPSEVGMWKTLISTLTSSIHNCSSNLEMILNMIRADLTYDDPGLFPPALLTTDAERFACRACNFWLINQLLRIATMDSYTSICSSYTRLQKEIAAACFIKQRWLALEISATFVQLLEQLNAYRPEASVSMNVFHVQSYNFAEVHSEDCAFADIAITNMKSCRMLRMHCLLVLAEFPSILASEWEPAVHTILASAMLAVQYCLSHGTLEEKTLCVLFARKYLKHHCHALPTHRSLQITVDTMALAATALERLKSWHSSGLVRVRHVGDFLTVMMDFFGTINGLKFRNVDDAWKHRVTVAATATLRATSVPLQISEQVTIATEKLNQQVHLYLKNLKPVATSASVLVSVMDHCPDVVLQMDNAIVEQLLKTTADNFAITVPDNSNIWATLVRKMESNEPLLERLIVLSHIINFKFQCRTLNDEKLVDESPKECFFFPSRATLLCTSNLFQASGARYCTLLDICFDVIHLPDCRLLSSTQQLTLLDVLFAPFEGTFLRGVTLGEQSAEKAYLKEADNTNSTRKYALERLCALRTDYLAEDVVKDAVRGRLIQLVTAIGSTSVDGESSEDGFFLQNVLLTQFQQLVLSLKLPISLIFEKILAPSLALCAIKPELTTSALGALEMLCCIRSAKDASEFRVYQRSPHRRNYECAACTQRSNQSADGYYHKKATEQLLSEGQSIELDDAVVSALERLKNARDVATRLAWAIFLPVALRHCDGLVSEERIAYWIPLFGDESMEVCQTVSKQAEVVMRILATKLSNEQERYEKCINLLLEELLRVIKHCLNQSPSYLYQYTVVRLVVAVVAGRAEAARIHGAGSCQETLMQSVRMMLFLLMQPESEVTNEASLAVAEMCARHEVSPWNILCWYRHDVIKLMAGLAVCNYRFSGISLYQSLTIVSHTFGCRDPIEFVGKHYKIMMAMLLPWCLRYPKCDELLRELAAIVRKELVAMLSMSFLTIYTYLFISEETEVTYRCIDYIMKLTGNSFCRLLHSDIKSTVPEILIFYHINAECVLHAIRSLLSKDCDTDQQVPTARIAEYIAGRFLGVLAYFEGTLVHPDAEKVLKSEALLSLGDIIRLLGGEHITPFRFKIIALLRTALGLQVPALTRHCVKIWRIFVCTVDVRQLGPLLSTIVVTLEPLLAQFPDDIDYIFRYLIMENNSLLGQFVGDLFFLEDTAIAVDVKRAVAQRAPPLSEQRYRFASQLDELIRHCNHENLTVRAYALAHLRRLCASNRSELNESILGQHQRISIGTISTLVETLIRGLGEQDVQIQLRAAECLGELGALAPSHLPPNYAPPGIGFALSVHSDAFAIIALRELCRAYQRQKDSKNVDSFSLAIQEILNERGVSPKAGKKVDVWETIPERLRPIMEPLLTSCYTTVAKAAPVFPHPVFGSVRSSLDWSYQWASQLIESIGQEGTRNLLRAFKPSLRWDNGTLSLLLPYILLHSLQLCDGGERQRNRIAEELQAVFDAAIADIDDATVVLPSSRTTMGKLFDLKPPIASRSSSMVSVDSTAESKSTDSTASEIAVQCAKFAFGLFDFLERWKRQQLKADPNNSAGTSAGADANARRNEAEVVDAFLNRFDSDLLAKVNFKCHEYARALLYLEQRSIGADRGPRLQAKLPFLAEIYSRLGDTDSIEGVMALKATEPTLSEQILHHNATGRLQEAVACYERLLQVTGAAVDPPKLEDLNSMIECYLRLDQPETALLLSESLLDRYYDTALRGPLQAIQAEPLYRLGRFEELEELLHYRQNTLSSEQPMGQHWGVICGSLIVKYRRTGLDDDAAGGEFEAQVERARLEVLRGRGTRSGSRTLDDLGTYEKRYEQVLKLHIISEIEQCGFLMRRVRQNGTTRKTIDDVSQLIGNLNTRLDVLHPNAMTLEPIISLRRILLKELKLTVERDDRIEREIGKELRQLIDRQIGELWMKSTELASRANMYQQALLYILHAESYRPPDLFIKNAKLLWDRRDMMGALKVLERGVNDILSEAGGSAAGSAVAANGADRMALPKALSRSNRLIYAEGKRLIAAYNAEASNISTDLNFRYFKEAVAANPESEIALVHLAQYADKLYASMSTSEQDSQRGQETLLEVMTWYGKSMIYGSSYIYQSMPRFLSIWLDCTAKLYPRSGCSELNVRDGGTSAVPSASRKIAQHMNKMVHKFRETLSPYFFFTAFSQLISRVAHPSPETYQVLKSIIIKLLINYPQQTLWMMLSVYKSSYANRVRRCMEILHDRQLSQVSEMSKLINDFNVLADRFIELTNKEIPGGTSSRTANVKVTVSMLVKALPKLLAESNFSNVLMPIQSCMQLVLDKSSGNAFKPYPMNAIYIRGIEEEVIVLHSLQKPRKITLRGHNGRLYTMMMKPKDDLRKDFRLMEFNAVVKQFLAQDPDAKHRRLHIRTYAVLPLNEECGIIEWISNLNTFRGIVFTYYKQRGLGMAASELRKHNYGRSEPLAKKRDAFLSILLPRHPAVFGEWFRDCFPNPHNWFQARSSYIKTTAVISIVGYILGLGDRHGENILFDSTNGDTVHVDFNCLFNRGETFQIPECVPFRLTHNMVDAMGPLGVEGLYRKCCEIVLRILQTKTPTLMSVLRPFVYDPMVSWSKISAGHGDQSSRDSSTERTDSAALQNVLNIEERLKGFVKINGKLSNMPLSIEGQVSHLIEEAIDIDNLAQMYIGWSGYI
ncbi:serine/threonine-protein kinase ATR-like [Anopheles albimanus]|uniref:serine/threonine-protein kinase ATR-like n=1 Tax=Anopheles albimanus TaxID=7167 RepID=UPI00163E8C0C|nr:serine/threonine-protein kinase ATR-like [Anopheles albimanus]XP_035792225.1 serine/threonine-protein kinase ATR-like [Anopheles albimanus]XP_035792226.1 serine/threonine-protein kinase ATR-like [Anopheles albimanus]XP_035792227.1 serine/threonine-protein kinase ATR-like [Anopheles albimanus]XP_035792228.1 serine/threonine-protein kinase ATR-like [Anopheles albimanus]XP_035792229.1 serine/threonine-protein kinase ATR-like [Anopheles albimanus]XP_035792230.1 serine/threonine-protein kinase 